MTETNWNGNIIIDSSTGIGLTRGCNSGSDTISIGDYSRLYSFEDCESCNDSIKLTFPSFYTGYNIATQDNDVRANLKLKVINGCDNCVVARTEEGAVFKYEQTLPANSTILYKTFNPTLDNLFTNCECVTALIGTMYSSIGEYAFSECHGLTEVDCSNVKTIENSAFYNCNSLATFNAKGYCSSDSPSGFNGIMSIGENAFYGCSSLRNLSSNSIQSIGENAFANSGLTTVEISYNGNINLNSTSFNFCSDLDDFIIHCNKIEMADTESYLFDGCDVLNSITLDCKEPLLNVNTAHIGSNVTIYVPGTQINDYKDSSSPWQYFRIFEYTGL